MLVYKMVHKLETQLHTEEDASIIKVAFFPFHSQHVFWSQTTAFCVDNLQLVWFCRQGVQLVLNGCFIKL